MGLSRVLYLILLLIAADSLAARSDYETELPSKRMREKAKTFSLDDAAPKDLAVKVQFRGPRQYFAGVRYGTDDSTRVALVLDQVSDNFDDFDLYCGLNCNLNRDRQFILETDRRILQSECV